MKILIEQGRVLDPASGRDEVTDVAIAAGRVLRIGAPPPDFAPNRVIDARGCWVLPGLVDLAARLREPGHEHARMLDAMKRKLETPLFTQYGREFVVPADLSIGLSLSKMEVVEVKASKWPGTIEELAVKLEQSYAKLLEERDARSRAKAAELA